MGKSTKGVKKAAKVEKFDLLDAVISKARAQNAKRDALIKKAGAPVRRRPAPQQEMHFDDVVNKTTKISSKSTGGRPAISLFYKLNQLEPFLAAQKSEKPSQRVVKEIIRPIKTTSASVKDNNKENSKQSDLQRPTKPVIASSSPKEAKKPSKIREFNFFEVERPEDVSSINRRQRKVEPKFPALIKEATRHQNSTSSTTPVKIPKKLDELSSRQPELRQVKAEPKKAEVVSEASKALKPKRRAPSMNWGALQKEKKIIMDEIDRKRKASTQLVTNEAKKPINDHH